MLRNVLDALQCDEFYLQREALFCLENLTLSEHLLTLSFEKEFSFGNFVGLLRVPNQVDVSFACMRIISRLLQLSLPIHHDFIDKTMQKFIEHGLLDILDDLQVQYN